MAKSKGTFMNDVTQRGGWGWGSLFVTQIYREQRGSLFMTQM